MNYEQCTSSQDTAADCSQTSFSGIDQLSLWSGTHTPAKSSENEQQTAGFPDCTCGKGTLDCLIHPSTPETWTAFMRDSLARILALPENKQALGQRRAVASTVKSYASLAWFDQNSFSWKTSQQSLLDQSAQSLETWPRSGMLLNGHVYELPIAGRDTSETVGGYSPDGKNFFHTPVTGTDGGSNSRRALKKRLLPTPTLCGDYNRKGASATSGDGLNTVLGGRSSPKFREWLMGLPINWTEIKELATVKSRSKPRSPMPRSKTPMKSKPKRRAKIDGIDYLALCRGQPCYLRLPSTFVCYMDTVVPCHSNQAKHGKGMGLKASDKFTVPGCAVCHRELDQGMTMNREQKFSVWDAAYAEWEIDRSTLIGD